MGHADEPAVRGYDWDAEDKAMDYGRIPLCVRIGVTGHRDIRDPDAAQCAVVSAFRALAGVLGLAEASPASPVLLQVYTPLAAGADQLAAEALLGLGIAGTELVVPVPSDEEGYLDSIGPDGSPDRKRHERLRGGAMVRTVRVPACADDAGFRRLGEWVVDRCDVLLALWDGRPAAAVPAGAPPGTGAIVSYALDHPREIPVIVVPVARCAAPAGPPAGAPQLLMRDEQSNPFRGLRLRVLGQRGSEPTGVCLTLAGQRDVLGRADEPERVAEFRRSIRSWPLDSGSGPLRRSAVGVSIRHLRLFNAPGRLQRLPQSLPRLPSRNQGGEAGFRTVVNRALPGEEPGSKAGTAAETVEKWGASRYRRANDLASRYQSVSHRLDRSVYLLAAVSVLAAAVRTIWTAPGSAAAFGLTVLDVAVLVTVSAVVVGDLRGRFRDQWLCFRAMAEYLRTYMFLAFINARTRTDAESMSLTSLGLTEFVGSAWFVRAMDAVLRHRPGLWPGNDQWKRWENPEDLPVLQAVLREWVLDQEDYHYRQARNRAALHARFLVVVSSLFLITVLAAMVHLFAAGLRFEDALNFVAIGVPGFAAAVNSIGASREHHRHSVRSRAAAHKLSSYYLPAILGAQTIAELREHAHELRRYVLGEATEWYEVMAVHSVEVPT